jgi:AmmeMemoRadiSam system protein B
MEDYCHAVEHSIEFQVVFLQHLLGPRVRVVPVLCGPFARATRDGLPDDDPGVARFLDALGEAARARSDSVLFVLGVDMAHVGRRYGDPFTARADEGRLAAVRAEDGERCRLLAAGDAEGFWGQVREGGDPLRWCGASPFYTFLRAARPASGALAHYEQWNIDDQSVVSFAALSFRR